MRNIAFVCTTPLDKRYPPASRIISLATLLHKENFNCTIFCSSSASVSTNTQELPYQVENCFSGQLVRKGGLSNVIFNTKQVFRLYANLRKSKTFQNQDVVIVRGDLACLLISRIIRKRNQIVILDFHGFLSHEKRAAGKYILAYLAELISRCTLKKVSALLMATRFDITEYRRDLLTFPLYNGVDQDLVIESTKALELRNKHANQKIVVAGTFSDYYEFDTIANAVVKLQTKYPKCELHIFGGGPKENKIAELAQNNPMVIYHGFVNHSQLYNFLKNEAFAGVLPVKADHLIYNQKGVTYFPRKVLEYLCVGLPVIFPAYAGKSECLREGVNSISYAPYSVDDCVSVFTKLFEDFDFYQQICNGSLESCRQFTWSNLLSNSGLIDYLKEPSTSSQLTF